MRMLRGFVGCVPNESYSSPNATAGTRPRRGAPAAAERTRKSRRVVDMSEGLEAERTLNQERLEHEARDRNVTAAPVPRRCTDSVLPRPRYALRSRQVCADAGRFGLFNSACGIGMFTSVP